MKKTTSIPTRVLLDKNISLKAKGLFAYLQSTHPDDKLSSVMIANENKEGVSAIRSAIAELEEHGYLLRIMVTSKSGKCTGCDYCLVGATGGEER